MADIQLAKDRITGLIRPWSRTDPFFDCSFGRLRGYPGNFEAIEIIYNYRPGGTITLRAEPANPASEPDAVRFVISDTGEGIPAEDLPYVFDRFWRGDRSRARGAALGAAWGWRSRGNWSMPTRDASVWRAR